MNLAEFITEFQDRHSRGEDMPQWVSGIFSALASAGAHDRIKSVLRFSMLEVTNPAFPMPETCVNALFKSLVVALSQPHISNDPGARQHNFISNFALGLLSSSSTGSTARSALDALGGPTCVMPVLDTLPPDLLHGFQAYASQDLLGTVGQSNARTPGVVLINEWIKKDPRVADRVAVVGLMSRLGENPLPSDASGHHAHAVRNVATLGLNAWLSGTSRFKYNLHLSKASRGDAHILATGLVALTRYHQWSPDDLACLRGSSLTPSRHLEKTLGRALADRAGQTWHPEQEIAAIRSRVRLSALSQQARQSQSPSSRPTPRM